MNEFTLIERYFAKPAQDKGREVEGVIHGIGDDCAVVRANANEDWLMTTDTLIEGRHFLPKQSPETLAQKIFAVNASDIAAMGGRPTLGLLSLTLPDMNKAWLKRFSKVFHDILRQHQVALIGGNTTRGHLAISMMLIGVVPKNQAILRSGAKVGDDIWVTGTLGLASLGLAILQGQSSLASRSAVARAAIKAYQTPSPPLSIAPALRGIAHAMIDVSDGLIQDVEHLACASKVQIHINVESLPCPLSSTQLKVTPSWWQGALSGGDDYQLLFTADPQQQHQLIQLSQTHLTSLHRIGSVVSTSKRGVVNVFHQGILVSMAVKGFQHF